MYERNIQQQKEEKGVNRGTPEHLVISNLSILMVTHYFDEVLIYVLTFDSTQNINKRSKFLEICGGIK